MLNEFFDLKWYILVLDRFVPKEKVAIVVVFEFLKLLEEVLSYISEEVLVYVMIVVPT